MNAVAVIFALTAGALHIGVGISEAFFFTRRGVQQFLLKKDASPPEVGLWAFSVGSYNMFLGAGAIIGAAGVRARLRALAAGTGSGRRR